MRRGPRRVVPLVREKAVAGRLIGRHILITGAGSGIGKATAELFAKEGARVALLDRDPLVSRVAEAVGGHGFVADVTDEKAVIDAVASAAAALGRLDGVVNAAGIASNSKIDSTTRSEWDRVMAVNLTGPFLVSRAALPFLRQVTASTVVNVASASALLPSGAAAVYAASKGGLVQFTKSSAAEWAPAIRVNAVCPGAVDTPMVNERFVRDEAFDSRIRATYALQRLSSPEEIARSILFLTSDDSSFVTGAALAVDGGRSYH